MEDESVKLLNGPAAETSQVDRAKDSTPHAVVKFGFPSLFVVLLAFSLSGPLVDSYFRIEGNELTIPHYTDQSEKIQLKVPAADIRSGRLIMENPSKRIVYKVGDETLDYEDFSYFREQLLGMRYTIAAWFAVKFLSYFTVACVGLGLAVYMWKREFPTTLIFKLGADLDNSWRKAFPVWCLLLVAMTAILRLLLVTSLVQSLSTRFALSALRRYMTSEAWLQFLTVFKGSNPRTYEMNVLISLGTWYRESGASWRFSTYSIVIECFVAMVGFLAVFYLDSRTVRSRLRMINPDGMVRKQLLNLPLQCRVLPLWVSLLSLFLSSLTSKFVGREVFNAGQKVNRLPWLSRLHLEPFQLIDDLVLSRTNGFWFNPAAVVDGAVVAWLPMVMVLVMGSVARWHSLSKLIEVIAYGYWIRTVSIIVTIYPTSMSVLQSPECFSGKEMSFLDALLGNEFCNDIMYSGHATLVLTPAFVMILMIIYGPFQFKTLSIIGIAIFVTCSVSIVVVGRFHYTADVLVASLVCSLLALIHAPAWKIIFSVRKFEFKLAATDDLQRVAAELEELGIRTVSLVKARRIDYNTTNWKELNSKFDRISQLVEKLGNSPAHLSDN